MLPKNKLRDKMIKNLKLYAEEIKDQKVVQGGQKIEKD